MKKLLIYTLFVIMVAPCCFAQRIKVVEQYMYISDGESVAYSLANAGMYAVLNSTVKTLDPTISDYATEYNKRLNYLFGGFVGFKINAALDTTQDRITSLLIDNQNLTAFLYYSKKKENTRLLADVQAEYDILKAELTKRYTVVVYGERINLYQNMTRTITRINRLLDIIEGNISSTVERKKQLEVMKSTTTKA